MRRPGLGRRRGPQDLAIARPLATIASVALKPCEVGENPLSTGIRVDIPRWRASKPLSVQPGTGSLTPRTCEASSQDFGRADARKKTEITQTSARSMARRV